MERDLKQRLKINNTKTHRHFANRSAKKPLLYTYSQQYLSCAMKVLEGATTTMKKERKERRKTFQCHGLLKKKEKERRLNEKKENIFVSPILKKEKKEKKR